MVATIGFFDGMHEGHRYVISQVMELAEKRGDGSVVLTFDRHPAALFCPDRVPKMLLTPEEKMEKIAACGVEDVVMFEFDEELASLTANEFLQILKEDYGVDTLLLGYDNHFGKKEKDENGNFINPTFEDYVKKGKEEGVRIKLLKEYRSEKSGNEKSPNHQIVQSSNATSSSTLIRKLLLDGNLEEANRRLGYRYSLSGKVVSGFQIGRKIGFPTANLKADETKLIPKNGVYAALAEIKSSNHQIAQSPNHQIAQSSDAMLKAIVNIGSRPTFDGNETTVEVHIIDFNEDIYDAEITVQLVARLRDEQKFNSPEELIQQINKDKEAALGLIHVVHRM